MEEDGKCGRQQARNKRARSSQTPGGRLQAQGGSKLMDICPNTLKKGKREEKVAKKQEKWVALVGIYIYIIYIRD